MPVRLTRMTKHPHDRYPRNRKIRGGGVLRDRGSVFGYRALIYIGIPALALAMIFLGPFFMDMAPDSTEHWERLSYIAQAVGVGFTVLTVFAVVAGVVTLRQQAQLKEAQIREDRAAREQATLAEHRELEQIAIDRPHLNGVWGGPADPRLRDDDPEALSYANMIMGFWLMSYHGGVTNEAEVRLAARQFFTGRIGRAYWKAAREDRTVSARDKIERRFYEFVDEEYRLALSTPPAPDVPLTPSAFAPAPPGPVRGMSERAAIAGAVGGVVAGAALSYLLRRYLARRVGRTGA